ncbi:MAG: RNA methyltransferase [Muribaculaceae bacterium]|nr:RNA methyltransferase [Muribaculaceae bacterium]
MDREKKNIFELTNCSVEEYREKEKLPVGVLLDNVRSMYNVGSVFRTSDAFLISEVILCGITGTPPHAEISKTALGAEESVRWHYEKDAVEAVRKMKEDGWKICVLEQAHSSIRLQNFQPLKDERYLLVAGNEVEGVSQEIVDLADIILEIDQYGVKHSLNVSVSVGIALWQLTKSSLITSKR